MTVQESASSGARTHVVFLWPLPGRRARRAPRMRSAKDDSRSAREGDVEGLQSRGLEQKVCTRVNAALLLPRGTASQLVRPQPGAANARQLEHRLGEGSQLSTFTPEGQRFAVNSRGMGVPYGRGLGVMFPAMLTSICHAKPPNRTHHAPRAHLGASRCLKFNHRTPLSSST